MRTGSKTNPIESIPIGHLCSKFFRIQQALITYLADGLLPTRLVLRQPAEETVFLVVQELGQLRYLGIQHPDFTLIRFSQLLEIFLQPLF